MGFAFSKMLSQLPPEVMTALEEMQKKKEELDLADAQVCGGARPAPMNEEMRFTVHGFTPRSRFAMPYM